MTNFEMTKSGQAVEAHTLAGGGLTARIMTYGASLIDLRLEGHRDPLVLGFETLADYETRGMFFGAVVGRHANRIANSRFELDGKEHVLDANEGSNHLHGGSGGFFNRVWTVVERNVDALTLEIVSPNGDQGYPGTVTARCRYSVEEGGVLHVVFETSSDALTISNLSHHAYFNLEDGGRTDVSAHQIRIDADHVLALDDQLIPTGEMKPVAGTGHDLRTMRPIDHFAIYDDNFCLSQEQTQLRHVAYVQAPSSGVSLDVETTEPGLQFYGGKNIATPTRGIDGIAYGPGSGICLEAQSWPDGPNHAHFPVCVLRPGETRRQETVYRFSKAG